MSFLRHIIGLIAALLFSVFGTNMAFAVPMVASDITYFKAEAIHFVQSDDVDFAARAPPLAVANITVTGGVTVMRGSAFALHGQETVTALFGFGGDFSATNGGLPVPENLGKNIHDGEQGKHIPGHSNYDPSKGRSILTANAGELLDGVHSGKYPIVRMAGDKPVVDFGKSIGNYGVNGPSTKYGIVHSGKNGAHIVPANPAQQ